MKHTNHLVVCLVLIGVAGLAYLFIPQVQSMGWFGLVILACPLMHLFMGHGEHGQTTNNKDQHH